jgi:L-histidine Nalpha-methyltransferase
MTSTSKAAKNVAADAPRDPGEPADLEFARELLRGLRRPDKSIPCRFLYDRRGSELFEQITELAEYYPTRTETNILETCMDEIRAATPSGSLLVEFGSGSSTKTEILLAALDRLAGYVAIDISPSALEEAKERLALRFPELAVFPVVGDFSASVDLPTEFAGTPRLGFFPGSTIGNLKPSEAVGLLANMREILGASCRLVIGVDLRKDRDILLAAYDDPRGVTAAFNLNLLARANRDLKTNFDLNKFEHLATYDSVLGRVDMNLVSKSDQIVCVLGHEIALAKGERIHTEHSHKYDIEGFRELARQAGWRPSRFWTDEKARFSVHELHNPS